MVLAESDSSEPSFPHCNYSFLEQQEPEKVQETEQEPSTSTIQDFSPNSLPESPSSSSSSSAIIDPLTPMILSAAFRHYRSTQPEPDRNNPVLFFQSYLRRLLGYVPQIVVEHVTIGEDGEVFETHEQIVIGDDFPQPEPRPASKSAVEKLPTIKASEEPSNECMVCLEVFKIGEELTELPCNHMYHKDCILTWLERKNTCPLCRHELPTDDARVGPIRRLRMIMMVYAVLLIVMVMGMGMLMVLAMTMIRFRIKKIRIIGSEGIGSHS